MRHFQTGNLTSNECRVRLAKAQATIDRMKGGRTTGTPTPHYRTTTKGGRRQIFQGAGSNNFYVNATATMGRQKFASLSAAKGRQRARKG
jgi:hypothetical protein